MKPQKSAARREPTLADRIEHFRARAGLSQSELARKVGVQPSAVANWKAGLAEPRQPTIAAIAVACGVTMARFWGPLSQPARSRG